MVQTLWYKVHAEREPTIIFDDSGVLLAGPESRLAFGKAKPQNVPVGSKLMVQ